MLKKRYIQVHYHRVCVFFTPTFTCRQCKKRKYILTLSLCMFFLHLHLPTCIVKKEIYIYIALYKFLGLCKIHVNKLGLRVGRLGELFVCTLSPCEFTILFFNLFFKWTRCFCSPSKSCSPSLFFLFIMVVHDGVHALIMNGVVFFIVPFYHFLCVKSWSREI